MNRDGFCVYIHRRLASGEPFYIGKGRNGRAIQRTSRNRHWTAIVEKDGGFRVSFAASNLDEHLALRLEVELIRKYRGAGCALANLTDGGEGFAGGRHTPEFKAALSARVRGVPRPDMRGKPAHNRGKPMLPHVKARLLEANKGGHTNLGRKHSDQTKANMAAAQRGNKNAAGHAAPYRGMKMPESVGRNISAAKKGRPNGWLGRPLTEQHKANLRAVWVKKKLAALAA
jgi:hypothetical protein